MHHLQGRPPNQGRVISISPHDIQPVFDTIAENAVRICQGQFSFVVRFDNELLRFGACHGLTPEGLEAFQRVLPRAAGDETAAGRAILPAPSCKSRMYWRILPMAVGPCPDGALSKHRRRADAA